jgi:REP element-mobilizing transposase RayT
MASTTTFSTAATTARTSLSKSRPTGDYRHFLQLYARYVEPVADTYAYCLLRNHFHLLVRIKREEEQTRQTFGVCSKTPKVSSPSQQFSNWFNAYAKAINKAYGRTGSLFERPFGRIPVTSDAYFAQLVVYIHRNPEKHGLVDDFRDWPYSSYHTLVSAKPTHLKRDEVLDWFGGPPGLARLHEQELAEGKLAPLLLEDFD